MGELWYVKTITDAFKDLYSSESGLSSGEAKNRLQQYGPNKLPEAKVDSLFTIFFRQFQSPLIYILLIACLTVFVMGDYADGGIILFVLLFNAVIGTFQEGRAQNTLLALKKFAETNATVLRDGKEAVIPDYEIVPGDVVILQEGDKVSADARIIEENNIMIDEAALTGESDPIHKNAEPLKGSALQTADQKNIVFKGTTVVAGHGKALVVSTGLETVFGKISKELSMIDSEIPLKGNIRALSKAIIIVVFSSTSFLFVIGILLGNSVRDMFKTVVSLAVSIIPEGLPIVLTLILAGGVWRMSKRNALVKKLQAVESLGQARIIAVDKTGTLTKNEIILQNVFIDGKYYEVTGNGYNPKGEFLLEQDSIDPLHHPALLLAGKIAAFGTNNNLIYDEEKKTWRASGDPTEAAIVVFARKLGFKEAVLAKETPRLSEIPFDYKYKFHATTHKENGEIVASIIGAPEVILEKCTDYWHDGKRHELTKEKRNEFESTLIEMSKKGLRVLAFATRATPPEKLKIEDIHKLTFVGFFGLKDMLRPEVHEAMRRTKEAGMKVVMITGDHKDTAIAIATEAGIYKKGDTVLTGEDLNKLSEKELADVIKNVTVFARVTPEHKLHIVKAYKHSGEIIAMTGDGVNDAPSLVAADLGVSMGKIGTEVAKEASDIILLDDNFGSITFAIEEGRNIYKTIKKVLLYLFSTSLGEMLTITVALL
ncbi:MAG TPA: HAD-IC family P-type ATPase, partial [Patescibacteria group bacterium]|nr:HAD-IC family P-type ATPase [Patescibacteria group bacterium]